MAPDEFGGTMSAVVAAEAIAHGWHKTKPADELIRRPVSDGGPGFVDVLDSSLRGERIACRVSGPRGQNVDGSVLLVTEDGGHTAYVESAQAAGRALLDVPDPLGATSVGVGQLVDAALRAGASRVVVGLGGTAVTDGGAGLLAALGAEADSGSLVEGGGGLAAVRGIRAERVRARFEGIDLVIASDVDSPLLGPRGAARGFAPQKGAGPDEVELLETGLTSFARLLGRTPDGRDPAVSLGAGAAGGLGYALLWLGGRRVPGIELVLQAIRLRESIAEADLVVTGEGTFDWQSARGKAIGGVAEAAMEVGRPCLVLAGQVRLDRREYPPGVSGARGVADLLGSPEAALADPAGGLAVLAARAALTWSRS